MAENPKFDEEHWDASKKLSGPYVDEYREIHIEIL